ncbi:MAG: hypothetical protein JNL42_06605 [Anaerolineae bacterium]|nr:hypothetical protein [Anaerolineae bacterium]
MNRRRDAQDDDLGPFSDPLEEDVFGDSPAARDRGEGDMDILRSYEDEADSAELLDEIERPRRRGSGAGGSVDLGALIGGLIAALLNGLLFAVFFLAVSGALVIGARALGILEGGPVSFSLASTSLSAVAPTQPPTASAALPTPAPAAAADTGTDLNGAPPTVIAAAPTVEPSATPVPECRPDDIQAWWALQQDNYDTFTALTPDAVLAEDNINALLERLRLRREYSAAATIPSLAEECIAGTRAALLSLFDATMIWGRALVGAPGTDPAALFQAEEALTGARAVMTAALWEIRIVEEAESPISENLARGSGAACGAAGWLEAVEPQFRALKEYAAQVDVVNLPASTIRELIGNMQAVQGNISQIVVPDCAFTPSQLLQGAMAQRITAYENQLAGRAQAGLDGLAEAARLEARFAAWMAWLG